MACIIPGIPERLHKGERETDNDFSIDTKIYIRVEPKYFLGDQDQNGDIRTYISHIAFKTNLQSCNRDKYSERDDVLFNINAATHADHFNNWGVISLNKDLLFNEEFNHPSLPEQYKLGLIHSVDDCMYPHSEIVIYKSDDENKNNIELNAKTLKAGIKTFYTDNLFIEKTPD